MNPSIKLNFVVIGFNATLFLLLIEKFDSNILTVFAVTFIFVSIIYCMKSVVGFSGATQKNRRGLNRTDPKPLFDSAGKLYAKGVAYLVAAVFCIFLTWLIYGTKK